MVWGMTLPNGLIYIKEIEGNLNDPSIRGRGKMFRGGRKKITAAGPGKKTSARPRG